MPPLRVSQSDIYSQNFTRCCAGLLSLVKWRFVADFDDDGDDDDDDKLLMLAMCAL